MTRRELRVAGLSEPISQCELSVREPSQLSLLTGLVNAPRPSTSTVTSSPSFNRTLGSRNTPTPAGVPVAIRSPGCSVIRLAHVGDDLRHREDHLRSRGVLHRLAVEDAANLQRLRVFDLLARHQARSDRTEAVRGLAARPLSVGELQVASADVVETQITADRVERVALGGPAGASTDHDPELGLVIDLFMTRAVG